MTIKLQSSTSIQLISDIYVSAVYSPPQIQFRSSLCEFIVNTIDELRTCYNNAEHIILGDFNDMDTQPFTDQCQLTQIVTTPTRSNSILDKIFTSIPDKYDTPKICASIANCDHHLVYAKPLNQHQPPLPKRLVYRPPRDSSIRSFGQWITQEDWSLIYSEPDAENKLLLFQESLISHYKQHFTEVTIIQKPKDKPCINSTIRRLIEQREAEFKVNGKSYAFKEIRNKIQKEICTAKKQMYRRKIKNLRRTEPGKWHQQVRLLTGVKKKKPPLLHQMNKEPSILAEELNLHFAKICSQLPALDITKLPTYLPVLPPPTITRNEVYTQLRRLNTSKAGHPSDLPIRLIKEFAFEIAEPLTIIFNSCLIQGTFPNLWKIASMTPVPKVKRAKDFASFRPISITPILARIFEGFLAEWVMDDMKHNIDTQQFGTSKAVLLITI
ncbi:uncharacterized protein LOC117114126 [Anneissia japonica]|uniref:uncharacterized protein LOC117114126 n=1 Tax=Anneissia japonica TaxID=1529436 RepID=UPI0014258628|nr:uncharacterized protein LOC117114126 [Anneissia japonica]